MSLLPFKRRPGFKPKHPYTIDWDNPLTDGLYDIYLFDNQGGLKSLRYQHEINPHSSDVNPKSTTTRSEADYISIPNLPINTWDEATFILKVSDVVGQSDINSRYLGVHYSGGDDIRIYKSGTNQITISWDDGTPTNQVLGFAEANENVIAISHDGSTQKAYLNGILATTVGDSFNFSGLDSTTQIGSTLSLTRVVYASYHYLFVFKKAVLDSVVKALYDDPYRILKAVNDPVYFIPTVEGVGVPIGIAGDTSIAFSVASSKTLSIGQSSESDTAQTISASKLATIGLGLESDIAFNVLASKLATIGLGLESDIAFNVLASKLATIGLGLESDIAFNVSSSAGVSIGLAIENNQAFLITASKDQVIGQALESDVAFNVSSSKLATIGLGLESDIAFNVSASKLAAIGLAIETNTAFALTISGDSTLTPGDLIAITNALLSADPSTYGHNTVGGMIQHIRHIGFKLYIDTDYTNTIYDGSQKHPFNTTTDAIDFAETNRIYNLVTVSELSLDRSLKNFTITGVGTPKIECNGNDLKNSEFFHCAMTGSYLDRITVQESQLIGPFHLNGFFENCAVTGAFTIPDGGVAFMTDCAPLVVGAVADIPTYDIGGVAGTASFVCMDYKGGIRIMNMNKATDNVKIVLNGGIVVLDSSCSLGDVRILGHGTFINESTLIPQVVNLVDPNKLQEVYNTQLNKRHTDEVAKTITTYEDDQVTVHKVFDYVENAKGELITVTQQ